MQPASVLGHLFLGGIFASTGIDHFRCFAEVRSLLAARGWLSSGPLALASAFEFAAGLCLALGAFRAPSRPRPRSLSE